MTQDAVLRRLSAILAADVVGYSKLMAADETGTLARFRQIRANVIDPTIAQFQGKIVGTAGDSLLVEFTNALAAVQCAVACQRELSLCNATEPEDRRITFRMGVNLGDVIAADDTIHGDGVNVASRLEKLAKPGGLCISRNVHDQVQSKLDLTIDDQGEHQVKNIAQPIRVYRVNVGEPTKQQGTPSAQGHHPDKQGKISIAVLPFTNMSGNAEQEYFSDGLTEDLITALAKFSDFSVIARNTSFQFKNRAVDVQAVGRQLGAQFVLEGSVRVGGNRIRVTAQLIETESGTHRWAERYDREVADVFALQDEIVANIAAQMSRNMVDAAVAIRRTSSPSNFTAYDHWLRSQAAWRRGAVLETLDEYTKSVTADPDFAIGLASLAFFWSEDIGMQITGKPVKEMETLSRQYIERVLALNEADESVHGQVGAALLSLGDLDEAKQHLETAITLNPHDTGYRMVLGLTIVFMGLHDEGLAMIEQAFRLEPRLGPAMQAVPFYAHFVIGDPTAAAADLARIENPLPFLHLLMGTCFAQADRDEEARRHISIFEAKKPSWYDVVGYVRMTARLARLPEDKARIVEGFRKAGYDV